MNELPSKSAVVFSLPVKGWLQGYKALLLLLCFSSAFAFAFFVAAGKTNVNSI